MEDAMINEQTTSASVNDAFSAFVPLISLTRGHVVVVDPDDYIVLATKKWCTCGYGYAHRKEHSEGKSITVKMHRLIMGAQGRHQVVDHINGNVRDNRRANLRICSQRENSWNSRMKSSNTSGYKGVSFDGRRKLWAARIRIEGGSKFLGYFDCANSAHEAYREAADGLHGAFSNTANHQSLSKRLPKLGVNRISVSGFKGVRKNGNGWTARISFKGKRYNLGTYSTVHEAHEAFERARANIDSGGELVPVARPAPHPDWENRLQNHQIVTTRGQLILVDEEDYPHISKFFWTVSKNGYARRGVKSGDKNTTYLMHREIMGLVSGDKRDVDHINGNRLDNRRSNLRVCTRSENTRNKMQPATNTSGYKGVTWSKSASKWVAQIELHGVKKYLGVFTSPEQAHQAYRQAAMVMHGEFANFGETRKR